MAILEAFELSPAELAEDKNRAMQTVLGMLQYEKMISKADAERFLNEYTFVPVRKSSLLDRMKKFIFGHDPDCKDSSYVYALVKIRENTEE